MIIHTDVSMSTIVEENRAEATESCNRPDQWARNTHMLAKFSVINCAEEQPFSQSPFKDSAEFALSHSHLHTASQPHEARAMPLETITWRIFFFG